MASTVLRDKEFIDYDLFISFHYSLPDIAFSINQSDIFLIQRDGQVSAQCLVENKKLYYNVTHFAYTDLNDAMELLIFMSEHYKQQGANFLEIGCGNASFEQMALFQRVGFRFLVIASNHFVGDMKTVQVENGIPVRDLVRFRINLKEKGLQTIGADFSGRTN